jgi:hypothetical protein
MPDPAYNQTDVWHDRGWLMANLQRPAHDPIRHASEIALNQLNVDEAMQQRSNALDLRAASEQQDQINFEANQRRQLAHDASVESYKQLTHDRDTEIDEQGHRLLQTMLRLDGALRKNQITKDQYDNALLDAGEQLPMAMRHPEAARHYEFAVDQADRQNQFVARNTERRAGMIAGKYGVDIQTDPSTGLASIPLTQQAAMQSDRGKAEQIQSMNHEMLQKYGIGTGVSSLFNPVAPHTSPDEGKSIDLPYVDPKTQQVGKLNVPTPLFNQMKSDFQDRYFNIVPQAAPQAPTTAPATSQTASTTQVSQIGSQADYDALAPGATFIHNGTQYKKPQPQTASE